jgi:hypothetical protein
MNEQSEKEKLHEFISFLDGNDFRNHELNYSYIAFRIMKALEIIAKELNDISEKR